MIRSLTGNWRGPVHFVVEGMKDVDYHLLETYCILARVEILHQYNTPARLVSHIRVRRGDLAVDSLHDPEPHDIDEFKHIIAMAVDALRDKEVDSVPRETGGSHAHP